MILCYVAGPYSGPTRDAVENNISRAVALSVEVAKLGVMPICPHLLTSGEIVDAQPYPFWIDGTLELMRRCDAIIMTPDWGRSNGARGEHAEAISRGMPIFYAIHELDAWLKERAA